MDHPTSFVYLFGLEQKAERIWNWMYTRLSMMDVSITEHYHESAGNNKRIRNAQDDEEEKKHFRRIVSAFTHYRKHSLARVAKTETYLASLPEHHQEILAGYRDHLAEVRRCIEKNDQIITKIITDVDSMFLNVHPEKPLSRSTNMHPLPIVSDLEKVQVTLKQLVRDWSSEGAREREMCYQPIIDEVLKNFPPEECEPKEIKVLVPGAGLGRLAFEIARQGYQCQGNEFSLFMLFASYFVLNRVQGVNLLKVYPWVHQYVNNLKAEHQTHGVPFPDINPSELPPHSQFSMVAGDFLEVYTEENNWDCVATCFFIDCANNVVAFIETIYKILKPGCVWINLGPLLYHFADILDEDSIEPSYEVVRHVIEKVGFVIEREDTNVATTYAQNPASMLQYEYKSVFMVCRKPEITTNGHLSPCAADSQPESPSCSPARSPHPREPSGLSSPDTEEH